MEPTEKSAPTPSRTLRIPQGGYEESKYDYKSTLNGNVYFLTFDEIEEATAAYQKLREDKVPVRYHVYSLFVKFDETLTTEKLAELVNDTLKDVAKNVTYTRVDASNHTGKVVVDRLDDCKILLAYRDTSSLRLRFYRFDPKKAIKRLDISYEKRPISPSRGAKVRDDSYRRQITDDSYPRNRTDNDGFTKVQPKSRKTGLYKNTAKYEPKSKTKT